MSAKPEVGAEAATEDLIEERSRALAEMVIFGASHREGTQFARPPLACVVVERLARDDSPRPKSNGRKDIQPNKE